MLAKAPTAKHSRRSTLAACIAGVIWLGIVGVCQGVLARYQFTPGAAPSIPTHWPTTAPFTLDPERHTLLVFAHPRCPCSRATFAELERLVARCGDRIRLIVCFTVDPARGLVVDDAHDTLWSSARAIPGADVHADDGARIASAFGARTSGQVALYAPSGALLFEGGITASRGHEGSNAGADAIASLVAHHASAAPSTPVFGCGLFDCEAATETES